MENGVFFGTRAWMGSGPRPTFNDGTDSSKYRSIINTIFVFLLFCEKPSNRSDGFSLWWNDEARETTMKKVFERKRSVERRQWCAVRRGFRNEIDYFSIMAKENKNIIEYCIEMSRKRYFQFRTEIAMTRCTQFVRCTENVKFWNDAIGRRLCSRPYSRWHGKCVDVK